jgi:hypothetical protein
MITDLEKLLQRIDALQALLACYRTASLPGEALHRRLALTKSYEDEIRSRERPTVMKGRPPHSFTDVEHD